MLKMESRRAPNQLRTHFLTVPHLRSCSVLVEWYCGSRFEPPKLHGACHLLEHLLLRESDETGSTARLLKDGGILDAMTSKETVSFVWQTPAETFAVGLRAFASGLCTPDLDDRKVFKSEQRIVGEELFEAAQDPADAVYDLSNAALWPIDRLGAPTGGTVKSIGEIQLGGLIKFFSERFTAANLAVSVVSPFEADQLAELLGASAFARLRAGSWNAAQEPTVSAPNVWDSEFASGNSEIAQCVVAYRLPATGPHVPLDVFNEYFGGGPRSRLYRLMVAQLGLTYEVWSEIVRYSSDTILRVSFATRRSQIESVLAVIRSELQDAATAADDQLVLATKSLYGKFVMASDQPHQLVTQLPLLQGLEMHSVDDYANLITQASPEEIRAVARGVAGTEAVVTTL